MHIPTPACWKVAAWFSGNFLQPAKITSGPNAIWLQNYFISAEVNSDNLQFGKTLKPFNIALYPMAIRKRKAAAGLDGFNVTY
jgi:hypothetical protein